MLFSPSLAKCVRVYSTSVIGPIASSHLGDGQGHSRLRLKKGPIIIKHVEQRVVIEDMDRSEIYLLAINHKLVSITEGNIPSCWM